MSAPDFLALAKLRETHPDRPDRAEGLADLLRSVWNSAIDEAADLVANENLDTADEIRALKVQP